MNILKKLDSLQEALSNDLFIIGIAVGVVTALLLTITAHKFKGGKDE